MKVKIRMKPCIYKKKPDWLGSDFYREEKKNGFVEAVKTEDGYYEYRCTSFEWNKDTWRINKDKVYEIKENQY